MHRKIKFSQKAWLKPCIDMNTKLRTKARNDIEKDVFKLMDNSVLGKVMENFRKCRDIRLVATDRRRSYLVSESNYHATKWFSENLLAIKKNKIEVKMNKPIYLGLPILEISKTVMYEFWFDYIKPKYEDKANLYCKDTDSFIINMKTRNVYKDIPNDIEKRFDISNYEFDRLYQWGKVKTVIRSM